MVYNISHYETRICIIMGYEITICVIMEYRYSDQERNHEDCKKDGEKAKRARLQ